MSYMSESRIREIIASVPNFKERAIEAKSIDNFLAYCVDDDEFCSHDISWDDYKSKKYFCVDVDNDNNVVCNRAFDNYLPLLMVADNYIEL